MSASGFWRGALVALLLSVVGALAFKLFVPLLGSGTGLKLLVVALGLAYGLYLLEQHGARSGRLLAAAAWLAVIALLAVFDPALWVWMSVQALAIWSLRCLYAHDRLGAALLDAGLNGVALAAALSTAMHTRSLFLTLWCFFLVQALYVLIPGTPNKPRPATAGDPFDQAQRSAEEALRRLYRQEKLS